MPTGKGAIPVGAELKEVETALDVEPARQAKRAPDVLGGPPVSPDARLALHRVTQMLGLATTSRAEIESEFAVGTGQGSLVAFDHEWRHIPLGLAAAE